MDIILNNMIRQLGMGLFLAMAMLLNFNVATAASQSGFIDNMPALKDKPDVPGAKSWEKEGVKASDYSKFLIKPITLFISPGSEYKGFDADEMKAVADRLRQALADALEPDYPVVDKPGAGVMVVRVAVTDMQLKKKKKGLFSYTPIGFVAGAATSSAGDNVNLTGAGMEWELLDGASGERLAVMVDPNALQAGKADDKQDWAAIEAALKNAADRFRRRVESDRSK